MLELTQILWVQDITHVWKQEPLNVHEKNGEGLIDWFSWCNGWVNKLTNEHKGCLSLPHVDHPWSDMYHPSLVLHRAYVWGSKLCHCVGFLTSISPEMDIVRSLFRSSTRLQWTRTIVDLGGSHRRPGHRYPLLSLTVNISMCYPIIMQASACHCKPHPLHYESYPGLSYVHWKSGWGSSLYLPHLLNYTLGCSFTCRVCGPGIAYRCPCVGGGSRVWVEDMGQCSSKHTGVHG